LPDHRAVPTFGTLAEALVSQPVAQRFILLLQGRIKARGLELRNPVFNFRIQIERLGVLLLDACNLLDARISNALVHRHA